MKYQYIQGSTGAKVEPYYCDSWWCEAGCDCGLTFEEAKGILVSYKALQADALPVECST